MDLQGTYASVLGTFTRSSQRTWSRLGALPPMARAFYRANKLREEDLRDAETQASLGHGEEAAEGFAVIANAAQPQGWRRLLRLGCRRDVPAFVRCQALQHVAENGYAPERAVRTAARAAPVHCEQARKALRIRLGCRLTLGTPPLRAPLESAGALCHALCRSAPPVLRGGEPQWEKSYSWSQRYGYDQAAVSPYFKAVASYGYISSSEDGTRIGVTALASTRAGISAEVFGVSFDLAYATAGFSMTASTRGLTAHAYAALLVHTLDQADPDGEENMHAVYLASVRYGLSAPTGLTVGPACDISEALASVPARVALSYSFSALNLAYFWGIPILGDLSIALEVFASADVKWKFGVVFPSTVNGLDWTTMLPLLALQVVPEVDAALSLEGSASLLIAKAAVKGTVTLARIKFPVNVGYVVLQTLGADLSAEYSFLDGTVSASLDVAGCSLSSFTCGIGEDNGGYSYEVQLLSWDPIASSTNAFFAKSPCTDDGRRGAIADWPAPLEGVRLLRQNVTALQWEVQGLMLVNGLPAFFMDPAKWPQICVNAACAMKWLPHLDIYKRPTFTLGGQTYGWQEYVVGADSYTNRLRSLSGLVTCPSKDRDEHPPASLNVGGCFARIMPADPSQNRAHGGTLGGFLASLRPGQRIAYVVPQACFTIATQECCANSDMRLTGAKWWSAGQCAAYHWNGQPVSVVAHRPMYAYGPRDARWKACSATTVDVARGTCTVVPV